MQLPYPSLTTRRSSLEISPAAPTVIIFRGLDDVSEILLPRINHRSAGLPRTHCNTHRGVSGREKKINNHSLRQTRAAVYTGHYFVPSFPATGNDRRERVWPIERVDLWSNKSIIPITNTGVRRVLMTTIWRRLAFSHRTRNKHHAFLCIPRSRSIRKRKYYRFIFPNMTNEKQQIEKKK